MTTSKNSVSTKVEETEPQLGAEAELGQPHDLSSDCKAITDILHPDIDSESDSDSNELTYVDDWTKNSTRHEIHSIYSTIIPREISYI